MGTDFITIMPEDKSEFVIRKQYLLELNAPYKEEPGKLFNLTREGKESVSFISKKEYNRLQKILCHPDPLS